MEKWQIYLGEAQTQIKFAKACYEAHLEAVRQGDTWETFFQLHHFVVHAVNVDKLLAAKPGSEREAILSGHISLDGIDLKPFRRLRNHLEHFDERLDMWVSKYHGQPFFDMNIVTGARGFQQFAFLRALDGDMFMFHGEDYPLALLHHELLEIEKRLPESAG